MIPQMIVISLGAFAVYLNTLFNGFVYDDAAQVLKNPWITDVKYIPEIFSSSAWGFQGPTTSNYYRPMMHVIYMVNYGLLGLTPWVFHLTNIIFHAGVSLMVFLITSRFFKEFLPEAKTYSHAPSLIAAGLFAVHPVHTEAVAWIAGLPEVSFTFFYLSSFYLYVRSGPDSKSGYPLSLVLFFLAVLCKETALTLPIILIAYDYVFREKRDFLGYLKRYIPYGILGGIYFVMRVHALGGMAPAKRYAMLSIYQYCFNIFPLFSQHLETLVLPVSLNAFHVFHPILSLFGVKGILTFIIAAAFAVLTLVAFRKNKLVFLGLFLVVVPLLPVLYIAGLGENTFAERYLYLPSVGFVMLLSLCFSWVKVNFPKWATRLAVIFVAISVFYSTGTICRNAVWKDDYTLFTDTVRKSPDGAIPRGILAHALIDKGQIDEGLRQMGIELGLAQNSDQKSVTHYNIGAVYFKEGLIEKAVEHFQMGLKLAPDDIYLHANLGLAYKKMGLLDKALEEYEAALRVRPDYAEARNNLGLIFLKKGMIDRAIEQYRFALTYYKNDAAAHYNLAMAYDEKGLTDNAVDEYQTALRLRPGFIEAHNNLGGVYRKKGMADKAIEQYRIVVRLDPGFVKAYLNMGSSYWDLGMKDKAVDCFRDAVNIRPENANAHFYLGIAYKGKGLMDQAIKQLETAARMDPSNAAFKTELANAYRSRKS